MVELLLLKRLQPGEVSGNPDGIDRRQEAVVRGQSLCCSRRTFLCGLRLGGSASQCIHLNWERCPSLSQDVVLDQGPILSELI